MQAYRMDGTQRRDRAWSPSRCKDCLFLGSVSISYPTGRRCRSYPRKALTLAETYPKAPRSRKCPRHAKIVRISSRYPGPMAPHPHPHPLAMWISHCFFPRSLSDETVASTGYVALVQAWPRVVGRLGGVEGVDHWHQLQRWKRDGSPVKVDMSYLAGKNKKNGN